MDVSLGCGCIIALIVVSVFAMISPERGLGLEANVSISSVCFLLLYRFIGLEFNESYISSLV